MRGQPTNTTRRTKIAINQNQITRKRRGPTDPEPSDRSRSLHSSIALNPSRYAQARPAPTRELQRGSSSHKTVIDKPRETRTSSTTEACKNHWFFMYFKHIDTSEAISPYAASTAPQPQALFRNSPKKFNVFLACFYTCFVNYEQRHRRRTTNFARATAVWFYSMFRKNGQRDCGYKHFLLKRQIGQMRRPFR